jgi:hypothetical protein
MLNSYRMHLPYLDICMYVCMFILRDGLSEGDEGSQLDCSVREKDLKKELLVTHFMDFIQHIRMH